jgi:hypothetical protein
VATNNNSDWTQQDPWAGARTALGGVVRQQGLHVVTNPYPSLYGENDIPTIRDAAHPVLVPDHPAHDQQGLCIPSPYPSLYG